ncbi:MAG: hypothetical protein IJ206_07940 [Oscillospiraceae bacterium]|nr:hypothetical protein [Oscillospiraceae bacterium]
MTQTLDQVKALYERYTEQATALEQNRKIGEGLLGFGKKPADDPCHMQFAEELAALLRTFAAEVPDSFQATQISEYVFRAQSEYRQILSIYWMLSAVHGAVEPLIPCLSDEDARRLLALYDKEVPRRERLPVQKQIYKLLKKQCR